LVRPQGLAAGDVERLADLNEILGDLPITELMGEAGWPRFIRERCQGLAPATIDRFGRCTPRCIQCSGRGARLRTAEDQAPCGTC
jgi:hypothetical protein